MIERVENPGSEMYSPATKIGELLKEQLQKDPHFYFFSPDETTSNKFDAVFEVEKRAWGKLPQEKWDLPESASGRIVEMLSENVLFSVMTGHLMNGEQAMLGSYEAFLPIITAQLLQQMKFIKQSREVKWREDMPAVNLLSTSTCWRQDHNGYTHQSPALISTLLSVPSGLANCIFPVDDVAAEEAFCYMLRSKNVVNLTTFNKIDEPRYIDSHHAKFQFDNGGASLYQFASDENPDIVFTAAGDIPTQETLKAIEILREDLPGIKLRFVGINALTYRAIGTVDNKLSKEKFTELFTDRKPIIANFHGYPETLENILENYTMRGRLRVHGYNEEGSTTTPFEMLRRNCASRYDLAIDVAGLIGREDLVAKYYDILNKNHDYAVQNGEDLIK
jgi:xylulose-5-phosphate/fructose-6-phosphate phosphoketolase